MKENYRKNVSYLRNVALIHYCGARFPPILLLSQLVSSLTLYHVPACSKAIYNKNMFPEAYSEGFSD